FDRISDEPPLRPAADDAHGLELRLDVTGEPDAQLRVILDLLTGARASRRPSNSTRSPGYLSHMPIAVFVLPTICLYNLGETNGRAGHYEETGKSRRCAPAPESRTWSPSRSPGNLVQSLGGPLRSTDRASGSARDRHPRQERKSDQSR